LQVQGMELNLPPAIEELLGKPEPGGAKLAFYVT
jgi:hypothetical protein